MHCPPGALVAVPGAAEGRLAGEHHTFPLRLGPREVPPGERNPVALFSRYQLPREVVLETH